MRIGECNYCIGLLGDRTGVELEEPVLCFESVLVGRVGRKHSLDGEAYILYVTTTVIYVQQRAVTLDPRKLRHRDGVRRPSNDIGKSSVAKRSALG